MGSSRTFSSYGLALLCSLIYAFLYLPIIVVVVMSFNKTPSSLEWTGFTFRWYHQLFHSVDVIHALKNSFIVALSATLLSSLLGLFFVLYGTKTFLRRFSSLFYATLAVPEIIIAVGLLSFFVFFYVSLGLATLIIGHTLLGLGYIVPLLRTRFLELDPRLTEASLDLGATETQTFTRIIIPMLMPTIIAAALLVFVISFDDFLISFFCSGGTTQTLPLYLYSMIRTGSSPVVHALSTLLLAMSSLLVLAFSFLQIGHKGK
jgi:spermidine/putrescine transport system permease protein